MAAVAVLERVHAQAARCPTDPTVAGYWHESVKADAATGAPTTDHGRQLLATLRPWPGVGRLGECLCGSSLLIADQEQDDVSIPEAW